MAVQDPSLDAWRGLVDLDRLAGWMDARGLGGGPIEEAARPPGGTQNILLKFRRGERWYMLRRPPLSPRMNGSETMRREARLLAGIAGTDVPHPRLIAACPEEDVLGAAFYLIFVDFGMIGSLSAMVRRSLTARSTRTRPMRKAFSAISPTLRTRRLPR